MPVHPAPPASKGRLRRSAFGVRRAAVVASCALLLQGAGANAPVSGAAVSPFAGASFWVRPAAPAVGVAKAYRAAGDATAAARISRIARTPTAVWLTSDSASLSAHVSAVMADAESHGSVPVFVLYFIFGRDCRGYSAGGASSPAAYAAWVRRVASGIGSRHAAVIVEPDAAAQAASGRCGDPNRTAAALKDAVTVLKSRTRSTVYLDAGNSAWYPNPTTLVPVLRAAGIARADGFSLNVSNFQWTSTQTAYGLRLSYLVGGKHFVIDTSRNGAGPLRKGTDYAGPTWCNPPGRKLGPAPTWNTGQPRVDAYLWVKYPGSSDGTCGVGDPPAGTFWPSYALRLAR